MKGKLRLFILLGLIIANNHVSSQSNSLQTNGEMKTGSLVKIEMLFPGGKPKALILSFDDGHLSDRRMVKLMNDYGLVGTFNLNSGRLGTTAYLTKEEVSVLFKGHEVSSQL